MPLALSVFLVALLPSVCGFAQSAQAQPIDRWHYIDQDSVLHAERVDGLHGAGLIQGDRIFAMLYLGLPDANGVVTVALPTPEPASSLTSVLIATNGQRFERTLAASDLETSRISDATIAYSFPITPRDIDLFKSAQTWNIRVGDETWAVTLTGSRRAILEAEERHADLLNGLSNSTEVTPTATPVSTD